MKNKRNIILFIIILIIVFISIYVLNSYTVFTSDDFSFLYDYKGVGLTKDINRITNISQIFTSMKILYLYVNGRIIFHFILQFLLMFPKYIFNIFNSLMFVILGLLIYKLSNSNKKIISEFKPLTLVLIYSLMYLILPSFGMTILWCSGSLNYLWTTSFILMYFSYFNKLLSKKNINYKDYIIIFILSLVASNTLENASVSVLFFTIIKSILYYIKNKKVTLFMLLSLIGNIIGLYFLFTAASLSTREIIPTYISLYSITNKLRIIVSEMKTIFIMFIVVFILLFIILLKKNSNNKFNSDMIVYFYTALFSLLPLLLSPYIASRAFFLSYTLLIICIVYIIDLIVNKELITITFKMIIMFVTIYIYFSLCLKDVVSSYKDYKKLEEEILLSKENNILNVTVNDYNKEYNEYSAFNNKITFVTHNQKYWMNEWISFYYGVKTIKVKDK